MGYNIALWMASDVYELVLKHSFKALALDTMEFSFWKKVNDKVEVCGLVTYPTAKQTANSLSFGGSYKFSDSVTVKAKV